MSFEGIFNQWPTTLLKLSRYIYPGHILNGHYPKAFKTHFARHIPNGYSTQAFKIDLIRNILQWPLSANLKDIFDKEYILNGTLLKF